MIHFMKGKKQQRVELNHFCYSKYMLLSMLQLMGMCSQIWLITNLSFEILLISNDFKDV